MKCEECDGKGFIEYEHGLIMVICDCDKGKEITERTGEIRHDSIDRVISDNQPVGVVKEVKEKEDGLDIVAELTPEGVGKLKKIGMIDDSNSGTERDNQPTGSPDTGKPKQPKKPRAKKKAGKGSR